MFRLFVALLLLCICLSFSPHLLAQGSLPQMPAPEDLCSRGNTLSWQAVDGASGYRVRWRIPGQPWHLTDVLPADTSYDLQDLQANAEYEFQVQALAADRTVRHSSRGSSLRATADEPDTSTPVPTASATPSASESEPLSEAIQSEESCCPQVEDYSRVLEYETLCFNFDLNEMAPCIYRRACTGTCCRESPTNYPVEQETCGLWEFGQFLRSGDVSGERGSGSVDEILAALEATPENAHDLVDG